eukprot:c5185_g1_i1 orf=170-1072(+)
MMNIAKLRTFGCKSESGALLQYGSFRRTHWSMMFLADTSALMRWCRWECCNTGITSSCSKEDSLQPDLPRLFRIQRGCHGGGTEAPDSELEGTGPQGATQSLGAATSYKVREGDTLTSISNKFNVTVQSIALLNKIADVDYVTAGKLLLIPLENTKSGEVTDKADGPSSILASEDSGSKGVFVQTESSLSVVPVFTSSYSFQTWHVRLALCLVLVFVISSFVKRYISDLRTRRHKDVLRYQVEKEVQDSCHRPKLKRWQGILDDDRKIDDVDEDLLADGRTVLIVDYQSQVIGVVACHLQ